MGDVFSLLLSGIASAFGSGAQVFTNALAAIFGNLGDFINSILGDVWGALGEVAQQLGKIFQLLWNWIRDAVHWILHNALPTIQSWINTIRHKLSTLLHPIIAWLQAWKKAWDQYYQQVLRPVLNFIQRLRSILVIFRLLHLKWATELDNYLVQAETKIQTTFLQIRGEITTLLNWVNWILDPTGLFQPVTYVLSAIQTAGQMLAVLWGAQNVPVDPATAKAQAQVAASGLKTNATASFNSYYSNGLSADDQARQAQIQALYQNDGWRGF